MRPLTTPGAHSHPQALLLPWYLTGSLDDFQCAALAAHLHDCAPCRREFDTVSEVRCWLRECFGADPRPSPRIEQRVMESIVPLNLVSPGTDSDQ